MNIVFLDIDGVLNNDIDEMEMIWVGSQGWYCAELVVLLNKITDATHAKIVLSSTWRMGRTLEEIQHTLASMGVTAGCIGKTDYLTAPHIVRGNEIEKWILDNKVADEDYVILDDDSDMLFPQRFNFVQTHGLKGLTEKSVERAIKILSGGRHSEDREVEYIMEFKV